jgi:hypothetical protein
MGCGACRMVFEENTDSPLDPNLTNIPMTGTLQISEIEMLNKLYDSASIKIQMIELMRESIIDKLDELIYNTGACVFYNPDIVSCIRCILWKVSADSDGNIRKAHINFIEDEPFIQIKGEKNCNLKNQTKLLVNLLISYISDLFLLKNQIKKIDQAIPELVYIISENNENYLFGVRKKGDQNEFFEEGDQDNAGTNQQLIFKHKSYIPILNIIRSNNLKIKRAMDLFADLLTVHQLNINKIRYEFSTFRTSLEHLINIDKVGIEAYEKNIEDIYEICFMSRNVTIKKKDGQEGLDLEEKLGDGKVYMKSISEGKNKYMEIIETKKYLKEKRKKL